MILIGCVIHTPRRLAGIGMPLGCPSCLLDKLVSNNPKAETGFTWMQWEGLASVVDYNNEGGSFPEGFPEAPESSDSHAV